MLSTLRLVKQRSVWFERIILIIVGSLYPLGFAPIDIWPATILSIGILVNEIIAKAETDRIIIASHTAAKSNSVLKVHPIRSSFFAIIFYWCIGAFGVGVSWVYVSIHEFGHVPVVGAVAISFLLVLTLALIKAFAGRVINKLLTFFNPNHLLMILPGLWVIFEFIQTFIFSGFPWLLAGYSQMDGPLSGLASWLGVYGISWFLMAITCTLVFIFRHWLLTKRVNFQKELSSKLSSWLIILVVFTSFPMLSYFNHPEKIEANKKKLKVALVQPNIPQEQKWDRRYFSKIIDVLYQQSENHWGADLIVWPEGAIPAYQHQVRDILADLNQRAVASQTDLLLGLPTYQPEPEVSYSALISVGKYQQAYHKQVLVPFGEYVPLGNYLRGVIQFLNLPMSSFTPASADQQAIEFADYQVIPAICYEIAYPGIVHRLANQADSENSKAKVLVTVSNDAWFGDSLGPYQHMQMARMRALELGMPLVRSTNDGITAVVDAHGKVQAKLERYNQQTLSFNLALENYQTLYRKYGLLGVYLLLIFNFFCLVFVYLKNRN